MSTYGRLASDGGIMSYYLLEAEHDLPRTLVFDWDGTPGYVGGPYIDVRWIDDDVARATINTMKAGRKIDFTEDNFRNEIEEWLEHNLVDFLANEVD